MSTIIFQGNTYTFGATVSANPGTGTTSYVFGGLNAGSTYGFIIWSFNGFGPSSIVGPANITTLPQLLPESREMIGVFAYGWGLTDSFQALSYSSGSTVNMFYDSENMSVEWWNAPTVTRSPAGITLPNGQNNGIIHTTPSGFYSFYQSPNFVAGTTYVCSFYLNETLGSGGILMQILSVNGSVTPNLVANVSRKQLIPLEGSWTTSSTILRDGSLSGWIRYAFEFVAPYTTDSTKGIYYGVGPRTPDLAGIKNYYIGSPQLEKKI